MRGVCHVSSTEYLSTDRWWRVTRYPGQNQLDAELACPRCSVSTQLHEVRLEKNEDWILICLEPPTSTECHTVLRVLLFGVPSIFEAIDVGKLENDIWTQATHCYGWKELTTQHMIIPNRS